MDCFRCEEANARPLGRLVLKRTNGNPFFVGQFLTTITHEKLVQFNYETNEWEWSINELRMVQYPIFLCIEHYC